MYRIVMEKQTNRFMILFELYKKSNANIDFVEDAQMLANQLGLNLRNFLSAWKYLQMEELISVKPYKMNEYYHASITHKGIKAIEEVFYKEFERTYYFPSYREMMS